MIKRISGLFLVLVLLVVELATPLSAQGGTWTAETSMPAARSHAAAAVINDILYVAGGHDGSGGTTTLQAYNPATNTWSTLAAMPGRRYQGNGAGVISGELYVAGGWNYPDGSVPTSSLFIYNPGTNSWRSGANMPNLSANGATGVINGKLYVTTAANGYSGYRNYLHVYDPGTNSWTALASSAYAHSSPAFGVIGNKLYVAGGGDAATGAPQSMVEVYDPDTNTWTAKAPMPAAGSDFASAVLDGKLYASGGTVSGSKVSTVYVYDTVTDAWSTETSIPTARSGAAAGIINNNLYVAGGTNNSDTLAIVEALTVAPLSEPPAVTSNDADNIANTSARLNGNLTSLGSATSVNISFQWGTSSGSYANETSVVARTATGAFTLDLTNLSTNTTYYFRAKAVGDGTGYGTEMSFTTLTAPPTLTTTDASNIAVTSARLNGNLTSLGSATSVNVSFQWGTSSGSYTNETSAAARTITGAFNANLSGLSSNTTYYFRAKAVGDGTSYGTERSFTTALPNQAPVASFTYSPQSPANGQEITFNASASSDTDGSIANYAWDWGDGNTSSVTTSSINHTYTSAGTYVIQLTVRDDDNATDIEIATITVSAPSPVSSGRKSLPDPSTFAMVGSGLVLGVVYFGLKRLRRRVNRG